MATEHAMYIRVKRNKTTYFIQCNPAEKILDIKQKLHVLIDKPVNDQRLTLMPNGDVLDDSKSLADHNVENDAVVALTLRKDGNDFEDITIARPNDFYQNRDADGGSWGFQYFTPYVCWLPHEKYSMRAMGTRSLTEARNCFSLRL